jgi:hypothetical protein
VSLDFQIMQAFLQDNIRCLLLRTKRLASNFEKLLKTDLKGFGSFCFVKKVPPKELP